MFIVMVFKIGRKRIVVKIINKGWVCGLMVEGLIVMGLIFGFKNK